jgi:hypothetical protein
MPVKKRLAALLLVLLLFNHAALCEGAYYGSHPARDVYITQTVKHTCTLVAATMMLRNFSCQRGSPYLQVTDTGVRHFAWSDDYGLSHSFTIGQVEVACSEDISRAPDRKQYLIDSLIAHPEGVVIYDTGAPHAIWLFGYDAVSDTFWCADTISTRGGRAITLAESSIRGDGQQAKVDTIDKIWYVVDKEMRM